ncbi:MAG: hypothetical protein L6U99_04315 [Clostridium sp.]|nr:MAG: hypothetical protein L6U99_04315 [Clostridium sp.]
MKELLHMLKKEFCSRKKSFLDKYYYLKNKTKVLEYHRIMPDYYKLYSDYTRVIFF